MLQIYHASCLAEKAKSDGLAAKLQSPEIASEHVVPNLELSLFKQESVETQEGFAGQVDVGGAGSALLGRKRSVDVSIAAEEAEDESATKDDDADGLRRTSHELVHSKRPKIEASHTPDLSSVPPHRAPSIERPSTPDAVSVQEEPLSETAQAEIEKSSAGDPAQSDFGEERTKDGSDLGLEGVPMTEAELFKEFEGI